VQEGKLNVENLAKAYHLKNHLNEIERQKETIGGGGGLGITIQSAYQDADFIEAIRPAAVAELDKRINAKKAELAKLGVTFDCSYL
jgi:hypothetical protein